MPIIASRASAAYGAGFAAVTTVPYAGPFGAYDALASISVPSGGVNSVTFAGIPTGYKHLQIRARHLYTGSGANMIVRYNGSAISNSISHYLYGTGGGVTDSGNDSTNSIISFQSGASTTNFCLAVYDILDYASTSKNKTLRGVVGQEMNGSGIIGLVSGLAVTTSPISSLTFSYSGGTANFQEFTQFALYGVK